MLTVYATPTCEYCARLKTALDRDNIKYAEIDVEQDTDAADYVMSVNDGNRIVPTVQFDDGTTMTNPTVEQVKDHLASP